MNDLMRNDTQYWQVTIVPEKISGGRGNPALNALQCVSGGSLPMCGVNSQGVTALLNKEQLMRIAERPGIAGVQLASESNLIHLFLSC